VLFDIYNIIYQKKNFALSWVGMSCICICSIGPFKKLQINPRSWLEWSVT
jgi:hypothetical protein